jgi:hypothetical protein
MPLTNARERTMTPAMEGGLTSDMVVLDTTIICRNSGPHQNGSRIQATVATFRDLPAPPRPLSGCRQPAAEEIAYCLGWR